MLDSDEKNWNDDSNKLQDQVIESKDKPLFIYSYSISQNLIKEIIIKLDLNLSVTKQIKKADFIIGLKKSLQQNNCIQTVAKQKNIPIYAVKSASIYQVAKLIQFVMS